jgi:hypothetical protein
VTAILPVSTILGRPGPGCGLLCPAVLPLCRLRPIRSDPTHSCPAALPTPRGSNRDQTPLSLTQLSLVAAGLLGFGLATLGHYTGPRWLVGAGLLLAGVSVFWLYGLEVKRREAQERERAGKAE